MTPYQMQMVRLVQWDGAVDTVAGPVKCRDVVGKFPSHGLCHSEAFFINRRTPAVAPAEPLLPGHVYFVLPSEFFDAPLTLAALVAITRRRGVRVPSAELFHIERDADAAAGFRIRISPEFVAKILQGEPPAATAKATAASAEETEVTAVLSNAELRKEYRRLVITPPRRPRPMLDSIPEEPLPEPAPTKAKPAPTNAKSAPTKTLALRRKRKPIGGLRMFGCPAF